MKKFLYSLFPERFNKLKYSDKYKHAIFGTLIYLLTWMLFGDIIALIAVFCIGIGVEIYDKISGKGEADYKDVIATVVIPTIIYLIWQI